MKTRVLACLRAKSRTWQKPKIKLGDLPLTPRADYLPVWTGGGSGHTVKKTTVETHNQLISIKKSGSWLELAGMPPQYNLAPKDFGFPEKTADGKNVALKFTDYRKRAEGKA